MYSSYCNGSRYRMPDGEEKQRKQKKKFEYVNECAFLLFRIVYQNDIVYFTDDMFKEVNTLPNGTSIEVHNVVPRERSRTLYTRPTTTRPVRKERRPSVPQMMATNPLYEESSPIYSCLHNPSDLRSLNSHPQGSPPPPIPPASNNRGNELQFDIPPQVI